MINLEGFKELLSEIQDPLADTDKIEELIDMYESLGDELENAGDQLKEAEENSVDTATYGTLVDALCNLSLSEADKRDIIKSLDAEDSTWPLIESLQDVQAQSLIRIHWERVKRSVLNNLKP
jgi:Mg2+ and Co2+ transporter CorA